MTSKKKKPSPSNLKEENQRLLEALEARQAELVVLNSIQDGLASYLDIDSIFELVGERIAEIFPGHAVALYTYDAETDLAEAKFMLERGVRHDIPPIQPGPFLRRGIETKKPFMVQTRAEFKALGALTVEGTAESLSGIYCPLVVHDDVIGGLNIENPDREYAFTETDMRLVSTIASSLSVALENVRLFDETQHLLKETEQRAAELQIINSVQEGLASNLDMKAIYNLVGDKIRETFDADTAFIAFHDQEKQEIEFPFYADRDQRFPTVVTRPFGQGLPEVILGSGEPLLLSNADEMNALGAVTVPSPGTDQDLNQSFIGVPIFRDKQAIGATSVQSYQQSAFDDDDLRLLQTLTNAMSVALENARLFDETQHLLKETEQRATELQIINSVQEGLASNLDMKAIYNLVGYKIRETFDADTAFIVFHDREKQEIVIPFYADRSQRIPTVVTRPFGQGLAEVIIGSGEPLLLSNADEANALGAVNIPSPGADQDLNQSHLGAPIIRDGQAIGATSVQSYKQSAFDEDDLRLLQTLTNAMSVALENARLFDETQHLLQETEQRAAELATINTVSQALVAEPDLDALIELIGEQMRQTFTADIVYVALLDEETNLIQFPFTYGEDLEPMRLGEGLASKIIETGEPLLINQEMDRRRSEMGVALVGVGARSYLGVPIQIGGEALGVISVQSTSEEGRFGQDDLHLLNTIAANVSTAIRNARLFDEIKRQKQYYEAAIENSPAAIVLLTMDATVTGWNPAAEKLFGYEESEALGRNIDDLIAKTEVLHEEAVRLSNMAIQEKVIHILTKRSRKDGSLVDVEVSALPVVVDGKFVAFIAIYHDVTELQHARQAAEEANQAKSTFLANMSHELRTPLNAIIGFSRIVRRKGKDVLPEKQIENLDKVLVSADHLLSLINTVLDISKIEAGQMDVKPADFELPPLIDLVVSTNQPLMQKGVNLQVDVQPDFPVVHSDQEKIKQILINLLSNAAKFTRKGKIILNAHHDDDILNVEVMDTGIGVSEDALDRIFEDFQQADSSTTREYGGTGLGLPISRSLARLLGGDLTAASVEGEGSTFTLTLPMHYRDPYPGEASSTGEIADLPQLTGEPFILSIDDDRNVHELLKENLGERGYQVFGVCTGDEGIQLARELSPHAIALDILMPGKDGWQVLYELKSDPKTREIPVIMVSIVDNQSLGYQLGATDYLVKPLEEDAVLSALERIRTQPLGEAPIRLLVVDDDPNIPELVSQLLEKTSYKIDAAPDGAKALKAIRRQPPDVILLDLMMPNMDGFGLIESLRVEEIDIPIIVLTAKSLSPDELDILEGNVEQIIQKNGLDQEHLLKELNRTIEALSGNTTAG